MVPEPICPHACVLLKGAQKLVEFLLVLAEVSEILDGSHEAIRDYGGWMEPRAQGLTDLGLTQRCWLALNVLFDDPVLVKPCPCSVRANLLLPVPLKVACISCALKFPFTLPCRSLDM